MKILSALLFALLTSSALARPVSVHGYTKKDGTYVAPHVRTSPNSTINDNYSTKGNINSYTGKAGTVEPGRGAVYTQPTQSDQASTPPALTPAKHGPTQVDNPLEPAETK